MFVPPSLEFGLPIKLFRCSVAAAIQTLILALDPRPAPIGMVLRMVKMCAAGGFPLQTLSRMYKNALAAD